MTDRELLEECLEAFRAVKVADRAHKLLKKLHQKHLYGGDGRHVLANYYATLLADHLGKDQ